MKKLLGIMVLGLLLNGCVNWYGNSSYDASPPDFVFWFIFIIGLVIAYSVWMMIPVIPFPKNKELNKNKKINKSKRYAEMTFEMAISTCFIKYVTFDGKASKGEFWYWYLFYLICGIASAMVDVFIIGIQFENAGPVYWIVSLVIFLPTLAVGARRLHDVGKSGWWQLISITGIGIIPLIIWWASEGGVHQKRYVKKTSSNKSELADELRELKELYKEGTLSKKEFTKAKNKLLK